MRPIRHPTIGDLFHILLCLIKDLRVMRLSALLKIDSKIIEKQNTVLTTQTRMPGNK